MKKKPKTFAERFKTAVRRVWTINPVQRVVPLKKAYNRQKFKLNKEI
jgi:hypothetical protein